MTKDEIVDVIMQYLNLQLKGAMGHIHQEPYKGKFFELFAEAYNQGFIADKSLTIRALRDKLIAKKWVPHDAHKDTSQIKLLDHLLIFWYAWHYAWDHCDKKKF